MAIPPFNFKQLIPSTQGWLKAGSKLGRHRKPPGAEDELGAAAWDLFNWLRGSVTSGRWEAVYGMLSARLRTGARADELVRYLTRSAPRLRKAYRDAKVRRVRADGARAVLEVDWGRAGFALPELELVRESGSWRFDTVPWAGHLVSRQRGARVGEASAYMAASGASHWGRGRAGRLSWGICLVVLLAVPCLVAIFALFAHSWYVSLPLAAMFLLGLVVAVAWNLARPSGLRRKSSRARDRR